MSTEITTAFVQQYTSNVQLLLQQRGSVLRDAVMVGSHTGKAAKVVEQIGSVTAARRTTRHGDTQYGNTPHDARWVFPEDYAQADLVDDIDKLRMLIDPTSSYAINQAMAHGRAQDQQIIDALLGTAKTGENGSTSTAFDTTNQRIASGSTGLTVAKLRAAKKKLLANEVDVRMDPLYIAVTAEQLDNMLGTTEVTSSDYNSVKALVQGDVDTFMGFKFIHTELLGVDGSSDRRVIAWAKSGIHLGLWQDIHSKIDELPTKNYSVQVWTGMTTGATRLDEKKVVEILCSE